MVGIDFATDGVLYGVTGEYLYTINPSTGLATFLADVDIPPPSLMTALAADPLEPVEIENL